MRRNVACVMAFIAWLLVSCSSQTADHAAQSQAEVEEQGEGGIQDEDLDRLLEGYGMTVESGDGSVPEADGRDGEWVQVEYEDPDREKAFPEWLEEEVGRPVTIVQSGDRAAGRGDGPIPNDLILLMEKELVGQTSGGLGSGSPSFEIAIDEYQERYGEAGSDSGSIIQAYRYLLDGQAYCVTVRDSGGTSGFVDVTISRETEGGLVYLDALPLLSCVSVFEFGQELFLEAASYNYYCRDMGEILVYRLTSDGVDGYAEVSLAPDRFVWKDVYRNGMPYEGEVERYIQSVRDGLIAKTPASDDIRIFTGDETDRFDHGRKLRLRSVAGSYDYYEVDFNNDGVMEYVSRHFILPTNRSPLYLDRHFYKFTERGMAELGHEGYEGVGALAQLWFKKIDGKVFTFRLFLCGGYHYILNVTLIEGAKVTQVRTDMAVPVCGFRVKSQDGYP